MDDEEVARLLTKEAQDNSNKYLTEGLGAYRSSRPAGNAPKPNTRFLRHLIKETDSHNTALKRKEEREARERMRALKPQPEPPSASKSHSRRSDRPATTRDTEKRDRNDRDDRPRSHRRRTRSPSPSLDKDRSRRHRHRDESDRDRRRDDRHSHRERQRDTRHHSSSRKERRDRHRSYSRSRSRSRSPRRDRSSKSRSHGSTRESAHRSRRDRTPLRSRRPSTHKQSRQSTPTSASTTTLREPDYALADESDPLEDLVGPLPPTTSDAPIRSRGRGAYRAQASNIDAHFAKDYDPTLDVQPEEDEDTTNTTSRRHVPGLMTGDDDWEMALEALRDRTKWRQKGEERLRAAGINEGAIDRWKNAPASTGIDTERRPEDVQWSKRGEGREWDRGKFVNDQGHIDVRAEWSK